MLNVFWCYLFSLLLVKFVIRVRDRVFIYYTTIINNNKNNKCDDDDEMM